MVYATGNDLWDDGYACFVSGPTRDENYQHGDKQDDGVGFGRNEQYILERDDLFSLLGEHYWLGVQKEKKWSYFNGGLAQAVDWLYAMYPEDFNFSVGGRPSIDDKMYDFHLWVNSGKTIYEGREDEDDNKVYEHLQDYLDQRAVARYYEEPVRRFTTGWFDPRAPEGGLRVNEAAVGADAMDRLKRLEEATRRGAVSGHRIISGTNEVPYVLVNGSFGSDCTGGSTTSCTVTSNFESTQETATMQQVATDQSNDEKFDANTDDELNTGYSEGRAGQPSGYAALRQEDTGEDAIFVSLMLDEKYRGDFEFEVSGEDGGKRGLWAFGKEPWTYANIRGVRGPETSVWEKHSDVDLHALGLHDDTWWDKPLGDRAHYGYRQPTIGSAFTTGSGTFAAGEFQGTMRQGASDDRRDVGGLNQEWRRVRWPVNFEDLNWYLYELPGENFYDPVNLFWMSPEGVSGLSGSGYVRHEVEDWAAFVDPERLKCGFPDEEGNLLSGDALAERIADVGVVDGVECSDLRDLTGVPSGSSVVKWDRGEIEGDGYDDNVGFYPFQRGPSSGGWLGTYGQEMFPLDYFSIDGRAEDSDRDGVWNLNTVSRLYQNAPNKAVGEQVVLVKAGVERPSDAAAPVGTRKLNRFDFVIDEAEHFGSHSIPRLDSDGLRRFGFPRSLELKDNYVVQWPFQPISPNRPYLFVFTYYEVAHDAEIDFEIPEDDRPEGNEFYKNTLKVPERHIRRVICRGVILPSGYGPVAPRGGWVGAIEGGFNTAAGFVGDRVGDAVDFAQGVGDKVKGAVGAIGAVFDFLTHPEKWIHQILLGFALIPMETAERGVGLACDGAEVVDGYMEPGDEGSEPATLVTGDGVLVENQGVAAKREFEDDCLEQGTSVDAGVGDTVCLPADRVSGTESCADLPRLKLVLNGQRKDPGKDAFSANPPATVLSDFKPTWVSPPECKDPDPDGEVIRFDNRLIESKDDSKCEFDFIEAIDEEQLVDRDDGVGPGAYNMGLTRVRVGFALEWNDVPDNVADGIDGFVVEARPDPRSWSREDQGVLGDRLPIFYLPLEGQVYPGASPGERREIRVDGFYFGTLRDSSVYEHFEQSGCGSGVTVTEVGCVMSLGALGTQDHLNRFHSFLDNLPVAPTFEHSFRVRAFRGEGPPGNRDVGPWSDWVTVDGGEHACDAEPPAPNHIRWAYGCEGALAPPGADPNDNRGYYGRVVQDDVLSGGVSPVAASTLASIAGYRFSLPLAQISGPTGLVDDSELRVGLLDLSGTEICGDLFSSTPSSLTWDNKAVEYGWRMVWILAGSVLFVLVVWQGLRMTYDTWLVGRVSTALRDMLPRFLIALILAAGSLMLCRMIIILVSDLTCFVAHSTGMTFWGVMGNSFVNVMKGFGNLFTSMSAETAVGATLLAAILIKFKLLVVLMFLLFWVAIILVMMFKVAFHMMMRLALIAVCIVMSPLAFALYASPDTSHWTGKWLRLFFGALAQQAVTLIVLYVGASFIRGVDAEGFGDYQEVLIAAILVVAMFALAIKVPRIINPEGEGYFSEFSGLVRMGAAAAMFVASAVSGGVGAVMGGGGGTFTTAGAGGGGLTPPTAGGGAVPGVPGGGPGGGAPGGGGSAAGGGGPLGAAGNWFARTGSSVSGAIRQGGRQASGGGGGGAMGRFVQGMGEGARRGQRMNNMMRNITDGNFMYRNMSVGDDSADRIEDLSAQLHALQPHVGGGAGGQGQGSRQRGRFRRNRRRP